MYIDLSKHLVLSQNQPKSAKSHQGYSYMPKSGRKFFACGGLKYTCFVRFRAFKYPKFSPAAAKKQCLKCFLVNSPPQAKIFEILHFTICFFNRFLGPFVKLSNNFGSSKSQNFRLRRVLDFAPIRIPPPLQRFLYLWRGGYSYMGGYS